jgi:hypothetical protein
MRIYASRLLTAGEVKKTCRQIKYLLETNQELSANILFLRMAGKRSELLRGSVK